MIKDIVVSGKWAVTPMHVLAVVVMLAVAGALMRRKRRQPCQATRCLHVFGSFSSEYYEGVSTYYAKSAYDNVVTGEHAPKGYEHFYMRAHPDGLWSFPVSPLDADLASADRVSLSCAIAKVAELAPDAVIPHMFCMTGMTVGRGFFRMLDVPVVGNSPEAMALSTNKWHTRSIMESAGVPVAKGELLLTGDMPTLKPPFIVKPNREDNSQGIKLVRKPEDVAEAIAYAFKFDSQVIVEDFIPLGHEIRIAVVEDEKGQPTIVLPIAEYIFEGKEPIRTPEDKLATDSRGVPTKTTQGQARRVLPAEFPEDVYKRIKEASFRAHKALDCRDYSIYDIRISPEGIPYFLEASLYCSFAAGSIMVLMHQAANASPTELFDTITQRTVSKHRAEVASRAGGVKLLGI